VTAINAIFVSHFQKADLNSDGVISYEEFVQYLQAHFLDPCKSTLGVSASDIEDMVKEETENST
jgi:Ca2+-binding EF-hand superfamily protein